MKRRFLVAVVRLAAIVLAATAFGVAINSPAQAFGGETFGCRVSPGADPNFYEQCFNNRPASTYNVAFAVRNLSGDDYTFAWTVTGNFLSTSGCIATSSVCGVNMRGRNRDSEATVTVTFTQGGLSATKSATVYIQAYCGTQPC